MRVEIRETAFDPWRELEAYQLRALPAGRYGATAVFVGTMRDFNEGQGVRGMTLEHYPGMTERYLERISGEAGERWALLDSLIVHRVGPLEPNDPIVLVAVWSAHRKDAFEACRWLMEELKSRAPFWKKEEQSDGGSRWVEKNTEGY
ncbi:molybdenum cofactor biosynthesis protein MoaE [Thiohalobacter sp. IOR34]|uniref:molybdenum cofactor biosynthesis protein MoaE n=1 Tax=Thiohalobacter sp. IOR34 TaxID=3057176 RepID=UPI0025AEE4E4|nr:molybdenum cofactor biosynthesis protein MoaE [Thiohalobacter sp. IOR34]WJW75243.1 molybdenum cofactor biosynthesis protein MoaE [Thiohalobacter sp. IOR34]